MSNIDKKHRIAKAEQDALMMYVQSIINKKGPRSEQLSDAYQTYLQSNATVHSKRNSDKTNWQMKRLTYASLSEFLNACDMTYKEAIEVISGRQVKWPSEEQAYLCSYLEMMREDQVDHIRKLFWSMLPKDYKELYDLSEMRTYRIQKIISYRNPNKNFRKILTEKYGLPNVWKLSYSEAAYYNIFPISLLPVLSEEGQVGLHWLMGLDETESILATNGKVEQILDYYCLLPQETKQILYESITGEEYACHADEK